VAKEAAEGVRARSQRRPSGRERRRRGRGSEASRRARRAVREGGRGLTKFQEELGKLLEIGLDGPGEGLFDHFPLLVQTSSAHQVIKIEYRSF